jgi:2-isopropylmalate synthase
MDKPEPMFDWNEAGERWERPAVRIQLNDQTLRDGLQASSVHSPSLERKLAILHLMDRLGVDTADLGLPGAGPHAAREVTRLAEEIRDARLTLRPNCAARPLQPDIAAILEISQKVGIPIEACVFIGSSPIRQYAEGWTVDLMQRHTEEAVSYAATSGLPVSCVTEDTVRAEPETLRLLFLAAIRSGAQRLCLSDTVGHATPAGTASLVRFAREVVRESGAEVGLDWHGHSDRGLGVANTLSAIRAGVSRAHGCALGLGERAGNTPLDQLLVNLRLLGWIENDLTALDEYCREVSAATGVPIPPGYPAVGRDAFRSGSGVHAAAVLKAVRDGRETIAQRAYCGVPAALVGRRSEIEVGPLSGAGNAVWWLQSRGLEPSPERAQALLQRARSVDRVLTETEIRAVLDSLDETREPRARP